MRSGLILMTALPPTLGHKYLIDFANRYMRSLPDGGEIDILMNSRPCEPIPGDIRFDALRAHFDGPKYEWLYFHHYDQDIPQNPSEHPDFWNIWKDLIRKETANKPGDIVFASEEYGKKLAEVLECEFVPCNVYRQIIDVSGTLIRHGGPDFYYTQILPEMRPYFRKTITVFGAESCGKTTLSKHLAKALRGQWVPEWAREYLELCGAEVTEQKMNHIVHAQYASQQCVLAMNDKPFIVQDTDLLTTIGYYRIMGFPMPNDAVALFKATKSDLYIMMNDRIPFEPDILRYGNGARETDMKFWIDLLEEFGCNYHVMQATDPHGQIGEATKAVLEPYYEEFRALREFVRT